MSKIVQRDESGKFLPGHAPTSPGRPKRPVEIEYLNILKQGVTPDDWKKIVMTAVSLAMAGDWKAREWLSNYLIGKPPQILEISASDATLLKQVIEGLEKRGIVASAIFNAMLEEMQLSDIVQGEADTDEQ